MAIILCWNRDLLPHPGSAIGIILQLKKALFDTEPFRLTLKTLDLPHD